MALDHLINIHCIDSSSFAIDHYHCSASPLWPLFLPTKSGHLHSQSRLRKWQIVLHCSQVSLSQSVCHPRDFLFFFTITRDGRKSGWQCLLYWTLIIVITMNACIHRALCLLATIDKSTSTTSAIRTRQFNQLNHVHFFLLRSTAVPPWVSIIFRSHFVFHIFHI